MVLIDFQLVLIDFPTVLIKFTMALVDCPCRVHNLCVREGRPVFYQLMASIGTLLIDRQLIVLMDFTTILIEFSMILIDCTMIDVTTVLIDYPKFLIDYDSLH